MSALSVREYDVRAFDSGHRYSARWPAAASISEQADVGRPEFSTTAVTTSGVAAGPHRWTREALLTAVVNHLNRDLAKASKLPCPRGISLLLTTLDALVFDDAPTPQLIVEDDGVIEVEWLVNGSSLTFVLEGDGEAQIWAAASDGSELFGATLGPDAGSFDAATLVRAATYLRELAPDVRERVWGEPQR